MTASAPSRKRSPRSARGRRHRPTVIAELARLARYGVVGVVATIVHLSVAEVLLLVAHLSPYAANAIAFCAGFGVSFLGHQLFTFQNQANPVRALPRFLLIAVAGFTVNNVVLATLVGSKLVPDAVALVAAVAVVPIASYVVARFWAFRVA